MAGRGRLLHRVCSFFAALLVLVPVAAAATGHLEVEVVDHEGRPVAGAVVSLRGLAGVPAPLVTDAAVIEQVRGQFSPDVLVIEVGTPVRFPNLDRIRHHVYSFSPAKRFELPLYSGEAHEPVVFDSPGLVTLGCNIHDWMIGYVVVLDTPWHARSDSDGTASFEVPRGDWMVQVWHPLMPSGVEPVSQSVDLDQGVERARVVLDLSRPPSIRERNDSTGAGRP